MCRLNCPFRLRLVQGWAACSAGLNQPVGSRPLLGPLLQIYADGHCGALRQRDLLSSDATVLSVNSLHEMWFTRLLLSW